MLKLYMVYVHAKYVLYISHKRIAYILSRCMLNSDSGPWGAQYTINVICSIYSSLSYNLQCSIRCSTYYTSPLHIVYTVYICLLNYYVGPWWAQSTFSEFARWQLVHIQMNNKEITIYIYINKCKHISTRNLSYIF